MPPPRSLAAVKEGEDHAPVEAPLAPGDAAAVLAGIFGGDAESATPTPTPPAAALSFSEGRPLLLLASVVRALDGDPSAADAKVLGRIADWSIQVVHRGLKSLAGEGGEAGKGGKGGL